MKQLIKDRDNQKDLVSFLKSEADKLSIDDNKTISLIAKINILLYKAKNKYFDLQTKLNLRITEVNDG